MTRKPTPVAKANFMNSGIGIKKGERYVVSLPIDLSSGRDVSTCEGRVG